MSHGILRPLFDNTLAELFVTGVLGFTEPAMIVDAVDLIVDAELPLCTITDKTTIRSTAYRHVHHKTSLDRQQLRDKAYVELSTKVRLGDDDKITMNRGGAMPPNPVSALKQAFVLIGPPASGKSGIATKIADRFDAVILDNDYAKRKFPEFKARGTYGASIVHEEASLVVFGGKGYTGRSLFAKCVVNGYNMVIPKIGDDHNSLLQFIADLKREDYTVHLILISLDRIEATRRAYFRFKKSKRYVPLSLILDGFSNNPIIAYYRIKHHPDISSYAKISTAGPMGSRKQVLEAIGPNHHNCRRFFDRLVN